MATVLRALAAALLMLAGNALALPAHLAVGDLDASYCEGTDSSQEYWYRRNPPLVGYGRGEQLLAGGSGACVLGFAKGAHIVLNGQPIELVAGEVHPNGQSFSSRDGTLSVRIRETGYDSSCVAGEDKCCGEYTYATVTIQLGSRKHAIEVVRYQGG